MKKLFIIGAAALAGIGFAVFKFMRAKTGMTA